MSIKELDLISFRNHNHLQLTFGKGINVIWGENGSGKTAILEAIHTLSIGRSFRTSRFRDLLKDGKDFFRVTGVFVHDKEEQNVQVNQTKDGRRRILVNGVPISGLKELIGKNPVVLLSPEEQEITKGNPSVRRAFFDRLFSVVSQPFLQALSEYTRTLKQRNAALCLVRDNKADVNSVKAWDDLLVDNGVKVWSQREHLFSQFADHLQQTVVDYAESGVVVVCLHEKTQHTNPDQFRKALADNLNQDVYLGRTTVGPHRDNYKIVFQDRDLRLFGSQGEHKLTLVLLKLAEFRLIHKRTGILPILLLDDLFAKLDYRRSENVLSLIEKDVQTIVTTTDLVPIEQHNINLKQNGNSSIYLERPCRA
ncbi:MAG: DNA replication/repair protein RecF [FCB group bacterium]|nr:DNA replication/repair protein RecF [FCB group bacterium]